MVSETRVPEVRSAKILLIRQIKPDEWALLKQVRLAALRDTPSAFGKTLEEDSALPDTVWQDRAAGHHSFTAIALEVSDPVGLAVGLPDPDDNARAYLVSMWVAPSHRGTDTASGLVKLVEAWAMEKGVEQLFLGLNLPNDRAAAFYRKCGFEPYHGTPPQHPAVSSCTGAVLTKKLMQ